MYLYVEDSLFFHTTYNQHLFPLIPCWFGAGVILLYSAGGSKFQSNVTENASASGKKYHSACVCICECMKALVCGYISVCAFCDHNITLVYINSSCAFVYDLASALLYPCTLDDSGLLTELRSLNKHTVNFCIPARRVLHLFSSLCWVLGSCLLWPPKILHTQNPKRKHRQNGIQGQ